MTNLEDKYVSEAAEGERPVTTLMIRNIPDDCTELLVYANHKIKKCPPSIGKLKQLVCRSCQSKQIP